MFEDLLQLGLRQIKFIDRDEVIGHQKQCLFEIFSKLEGILVLDDLLEIVSSI